MRELKQNWILDDLVVQEMEFLATEKQDDGTKREFFEKKALATCFNLKDRVHWHLDKLAE